MATATGTAVEETMAGTGAGEIVEEQVSTTGITTGNTVRTTSQQLPQSTSPSQITTASMPAPSETYNSPTEQQFSVISTDIPHEPPAYSSTPPLPSPSSPSYSPPSPPLPPSPVISPVRTLPAIRPASFPLLTDLNIPNNTPRPYTFPIPPPPASHPRSPSIAIDIFPDPDADPQQHDEPLPTYSRYPKRGEAHCIGEVGNPDDRSDNSESLWDERSRGTSGGKWMCCGSGIYMRTVIAGVALLIVACVIGGAVLGWQMKSQFGGSKEENQGSTTLGGGSGPYDGGNVDYWNPPATHDIPEKGGTTTLVPGPTPTDTGSGAGTTTLAVEDMEFSIATLDELLTKTQKTLLLTMTMPLKERVTGI